MSEPSCKHSHLPGGVGCIVCEVEAFEAYQKWLEHQVKPIIDPRPPSSAPAVNESP